MHFDCQPGTAAAFSAGCKEIRENLLILSMISGAVRKFDNTIPRRNLGQTRSIVLS